MACDNLRQYARYYIEVQYPDDRGRVTYEDARYAGSEWGQKKDKAGNVEYYAERELFVTDRKERLKLAPEWLVECRFLRSAVPNI